MTPDEEMGRLESEHTRLDQEIARLTSERASVYARMKDVAKRQGEAATKQPPLFDGTDIHLAHIRRCAYLHLHQDECLHGTISYGPHDGEDKAWYERCANCGKRITKEDRGKFDWY